jgi:hypothetical protein
VNPFPDVDPAYYKLGWQFRSDELQGIEREVFLSGIQAEGVALHAGFRGFMHRGPQRCRKVGELSNCRVAAMSALVLHHPVLLEAPEVIDQVALAMEKVTSVLATSQN